MSTKRILSPSAIKEMMISCHQKGKSLKEIADSTGKPCSTVQSIIKRWKGIGCLENQWCKGWSSTFSACNAIKLKPIIVKTNVGAPTDCIVKTFLAENPTNFSKWTIYRQLKKLKYVRKAIRKSMVISTKNKQLWIRWARTLKSLALDGKTFIFQMNAQKLLGRTLECIVGGGKMKKPKPLWRLASV